MSDLAAIHPKVRCEYMLENGGAAKARNWGAMQSQADFIAFLDADDVYENNVLNAAYLGLEAYSYLSLVRLKLRPIGFPEHYLNHPQFPTAWERLQMTVGGNTVFRRSIFLACGGFPQDELFRIFGGEDAALGIALTRDSVVGYLFEERDPAVKHNYRPGIHAERLLDAELFGKTVPGLTIDHQNEAETVTRRISRRLQEVKAHSTFEEAGTMPLYPEYE